MKFEHNHVVYLGTCPENNWSDNYVDQSAHRVSERVIDHSSRDKSSYLFNHSCIKNHPSTSNIKNHPNTSKTDFRIISSGFKNNYSRRKIAESKIISRHSLFPLSSMDFSIIKTGSFT